MLAAGDGGLLGRETSFGLVSRPPTSCLGRHPTDGKLMAVPSAGRVDMNHGGIGVVVVAGEGLWCRGAGWCGGDRAGAQPQAFLPLRPWVWGRESGSHWVATASRTPREGQAEDPS